MSTSLVYYDAAKVALAQAADIDEVKDIKDKAEALRLYAQQQRDESLEQFAAKIKSRAMRRIGELSAELETKQGERTELRSTAETKLEEGPSPPKTKQQSLETAGISKATAHRCERLAAIPEDEFDAAVEAGENVTAILKSVNVHVSNNSGENEWYTPAEYIEAARTAMGGIDLDPASCELANQTVKAETFFTAEDDGLAKEWHGKIFMNPPYSKDLMKFFAARVSNAYANEEIEQAIILVNNATETAWFQGMLEQASAVCFPRTRIKFIDKNGKPSGEPLQGQAILYMGENWKKFSAAFSKFGAVLLHVDEL